MCETHEGANVSTDKKLVEKALGLPVGNPTMISEVDLLKRVVKLLRQERKKAVDKTEQRFLKALDANEKADKTKVSTIDKKKGSVI